jgi:amino acid transporter/tRNA A-37 threonylcarbamoyl transferase component Bud32
MVESSGKRESNEPGLGLMTLSALVVANMIGAGVFTSSGFSLQALGNPGRVMLAWWLCGAWAIAGAIAYGALAQRLPLSGGEYLFLSRLVHPAVGFLAGWISVVAGFTAPIAVAAQGAAIYALGDVESGDWKLTLVAEGVILSAALCHLVGLSIGAGIQNAIVAAKLLLLVVIIAWAFLFSSSDVWQGGALAGQSPQWWPEDGSAWTVLVGSMSWIALSYTGFNAAIYVAGQAHQPRRTVPQSMIVSTLLVTVIYLLLNYVFVYAPAPETIAGQNNVAAIAATAVGGAPLRGLVRVTICLAMASSVFAMLLAGPRVYQKMAEDGVMPRLFRSQAGSPRWATVVQAGLSMVAVLLADLLQLMKYLGLTLSACGALAVLSLWWARRRIPQAAPLRWWETLAMVIYLSITAAILWASRETHADEFMAMLLTFALGGAVYALWNVGERAGLATTSTPSQPLPNCPPFQLTRHLASSPYSDVYLAQLPPATEPLVLKLQSSSSQASHSRQRVAREAEVLAQLKHPHIVGYLRTGETEEGRRYVAVEYVSGPTLWELVQQSGPIPQQRVLPLLKQLASALKAVHECGYVHADLSPKNILVSHTLVSHTLVSHAEQPQVSHSGTSQSEQMKLIDFGLAHPRQAGSVDGTRDSTLAQAQPPDSEGLSGTPAFMSPESCQGPGPTPATPLSPASDIYSLGCVAYFMLTGQLPFAGATSIEICWKQLNQPPPTLSQHQALQLDSRWEAWLGRCLQKSCHARPADMQQVIEELEQIVF